MQKAIFKDFKLSRLISPSTKQYKIKIHRIYQQLIKNFKQMIQATTEIKTNSLHLTKTKSLEVQA